jgi:ATP-dependent helicase/nuclease subunit B
LRLTEARAFIRSELRNGDLLLVAASRGAADDLARSMAIESGATVGLHRFSLTQLAARLAAPILAADRRSPATDLGSEAVAARATFESMRTGALTYFGPVAGTPGFPRALARTLQELRLAHVSSTDVAALPLGGADLSVLLDRFEREFDSASATDRAALFASATALASEQVRTSSLLRIPLLLVDIPLDSAAEFDFVRALISSAPDTLITVPFGDLQALDRLASIGIEPEVLEQKGDSDLVALRRYLFASRRPPERTPKRDVRLFSAPGEGRECVEIARRVMEEARAGVAFDQIAVFVRSPPRYASLLEHAFKRAGIPAWFDRGTSRPHPAGRAFLAMLACVCEKLSARRFAEYLSLAQVPQLTAERREFDFIVPDDEALPIVGNAARRVDGEDLNEDDTARSPSEPAGTKSSRRDLDVTDAVVAGSLRAPWKWETLIVESAVIGGDPARWHRRLDGLAREYRLMIQEELSEDPESPRALRLERELTNLGHLRAFALPIIDLLASWPPAGTWAEWLDRFSDLAPKILRQPDRVLRMIAELRPMSEIGPVSLEEARDVVADRLLALELDPPRHRYGRVFVGSPQQARGRTFRVVFVAGLAERMFPQKPHEDPMLLDKEMRVPLKAGLSVQETRGRMERLLLRLAVGAPTERLWLSYPRIDIAESRPRVPSFYALDVMRAITGRIPHHEELEERAVSEGGAMLAWPSPQEPARAIDDLEHDLAVLRTLLLADDPKSVRGHAHYLLRLNDALKRSVTTRWARARSAWTPFDGITRLTGMTTPLVASQRLSARPYSLSALQKFSTCPYQFLLSAIYRLEPAQEPEPLQKLDPLTRGALFHQVQAEFFRTLQADGLLPVSQGRLHEVLACLDRIVSKTAAEYHEQLAPAIERVWRDEVSDIARDLRVWARRLPSAQDWIPEYFEFSFGLSDQGRDTRSVPDPVRVDGRFLLRGSVDLIERRHDGGALRVTDHKTGRNRTTWKTVIGGGAMLQPVLYSVAVTQALETAVTSGRLFYCTAAGGFTDHEIPINDASRRAGLEALEIVDRAIELGFLPMAPADRACTWCDFRSVCGPHEEQRVRMKSADKLGDLLALRQMP